MCYHVAIMRVLILSDIHANLVALESVLNATAGRYDAVWCLGDVVGYGPRPNECVALMRERAALCVMGNHDWAVLGRPGIDVDDFNPHARQAVLWTREVLTAESRTYLEQLPHVPISPEVDKNLLLTHASPREPVLEYILTPSIAMENFAEFTEQICLIGHTHKPVIYRWRLHDEISTDVGLPESERQQIATVEMLQPQIGAPVKLNTSPQLRLIINPGSVGQPRDNDVRAAFAILDLEAKTWSYERIAYPIELTQNQMRAVNLPRRLIDRLSFGW
ncbi:metallophosphoesterase family protein [soil metagenome]